MIVDGVLQPCAHCGAPSKGKSKFCSGSCSAKYSHAKRYIKREEVLMDPSAVLGPEVVIAMAKKIKFVQRTRPTKWKLAAKWLKARER